MISIIICSVNPVLLQRLTENLANTVGVAYELIAIDNRIQKAGICKVYNEGARRARFDFLCFVHEDVTFETHDWGKKMLAHFDDPLVGLAGFAGGDAKSLVPSSWSTAVKPAYINLIQHFKNPISPPIHLFAKGAAHQNISAPVKTMDGVLLFTRKKVFAEISFDEHLLKGFHGYDIDFSLRVSESYRSIVVFDIFINHFSEGSLDRAWLDSQLIVSRKWKKKLPVFVDDVSVGEQVAFHWRALQIFVETLFRLQYTGSYIFSCLCKFAFNRFFTTRRFMSLIRYFITTAYRREILGQPVDMQQKITPLIAPRGEALLK